MGGGTNATVEDHLRSLWLCGLLACGGREESASPANGQSSSSVGVKSSQEAEQGFLPPGVGVGVSTGVDVQVDPNLELEPVQFEIVMRPPRDASEGQIRVTGYAGTDPETGQAPRGEPALLNYVVPLPADQEKVEVTLNLASGLYYQASFGPGSLPRSGDWTGPMVQWNRGQERFFLLLGQIKLEASD